MAYFRLNDEQAAQFAADGYLIVPGLLNPSETEVLFSIAKADQDLLTKAKAGLDGAGNKTDILVENDLHDDIYSAIAQSERVVGTLTRLLGDEVYHYHHKMTMKAPFEGGAWEWHQDYGYWYNNGCLFPDMGSVMIAVDRSDRENGCLQVIRGSHRLGRIDHGRVATQTGADVDRVEEVLQRMERVYVELEQGDAVFFHANTLHRSDTNRSPRPRWTFLCCYNTRHNDPYKLHHHPNYQPLELLPDDQVIGVGQAQWERMQVGQSVGAGV